MARRPKPQPQRAKQPKKWTMVEYLIWDVQQYGEPDSLQLANIINELMGYKVRRSRNQPINLGQERIMEALGPGFTYVSTGTNVGQRWIESHKDFVEAHKTFPRTNRPINWGGNNILYVNTSTGVVLSNRNARDRAVRFYAEEYGHARDYEAVSPSRADKTPIKVQDKWNLGFYGMGIKGSPKTRSEEGEDGEKKPIWMYPLGFIQLTANIPKHTESLVSERLDAAVAQMSVIKINFVWQRWNG